METASDTTDLIEAAADAVRAGQLIVFPTDTVFGIGCDPFNADALERLYEAKRRPREKSTPVLVDSVGMAEELGAISKHCSQLLEKHWSGALTVVVRQRTEFPDNLSVNETVALRMPDHSDLLELIARVGGALAATSANISGRTPLTTYDEVYAAFADIAAVVLPGVVRGGIPSTVIDCTADTPVILREGPVRIA